jgi:hypothetical protein
VLEDSSTAFLAWEGAYRSLWFALKGCGGGRERRDSGTSAHRRGKGLRRPPAGVCGARLRSPLLPPSSRADL